MTFHAKQRARERYSLAVYAEDFDDIALQVADGRAEKVGEHGKATSIYKVTVQQKICIIVYNRKAKSVITFLPMDYQSREDSGSNRKDLEVTFYRQGRKYTRQKEK